MSLETVVTICGNLTADPELRFTPSGAAVVSLTIAATPRTFDRNKNEWVDGDPTFLRCSAWRQFAENIAESYGRGDRVLAVGRLKQRSYEDREGVKRTVTELDLDDLGASAKFATMRVRRSKRGAESASSGVTIPGPGAAAEAAPAGDDAWAPAPALGLESVPA
jgi:single-strand DNA-binding protein